MLNFQNRTGPVFDPPVEYPPLVMPQWWCEAKLGFFVHWGVFSVPAWAYSGPLPDGGDPYAYHRYAEWYANTVRIPDSPTARWHDGEYELGTVYEDFADHWTAERFDATEFVGQLAAAGGKYVVVVTKHHDGFCLWETASTPFNSVRRGPRRDLIAEFATAARAANLRLGLYFSGALDWHVSDFPVIDSDEDLFALRRNDSAFAAYAANQLEELIEQFYPDILWNDIEWPDGGKGHEEYALAALLTRYLEKVPHGAVNDRWGVGCYGHLTREYSHVSDIVDEPWEATRGLGSSFGYNRNEDPAQTLSGAELVRLLIDVVAKNGNLLLNVGPMADGTLPPAQAEGLQVLGEWLDVNGDSIYGTRPWRRCGDAERLRYTVGDYRYVHVLDPAAGPAELPADVGRPDHWLDGAALEWDGDRVIIPDRLAHQPAATCVVTSTGEDA